MDIEDLEFKEKILVKITELEDRIIKLESDSIGIEDDLKDDLNDYDWFYK